MLVVDNKDMKKPGILIWLQKTRVKNQLSICIAWPDLILIRPKLRWTFGPEYRDTLVAEKSMRIVYEPFLGKRLVHEGVQVPDLAPLIQSRKPRKKPYNMSRWKHDHRGTHGRLFKTQGQAFEVPVKSMFRMAAAFDTNMVSLDLYPMVFDGQTVMIYFDKKYRPRAMVSLIKVEKP